MELLLIELLLLLHLHLELLLLLEQLIGYILLRHLAICHVFESLHLQKECLLVGFEPCFYVSDFIQLFLRPLLLAANLQCGMLPALVSGRLRRGIQHGCYLGNDADL